MIQLFNRAEISGDGGDKNTGGGITHTSVATIASASAGALKVIIEPAGARNAGAGWLLSPESGYRVSGAQRSNLTPGSYILQFITVNGFDAPAQQNIAVTAGQLKTVTFFTYASPQESWRQTYFGSSFNSDDGADHFDFDRDGFTNADEYVAGTSPTQTGDFLKAENPQRGENTFSLSTDGKEGRTYYLERSSTLNANYWISLTSNGPLTMDGPVTRIDTSSARGPYFYRIRVSGP